MDINSLIKTDDIDDKVQIILRQTDYSEEQAREKLLEFNYDEVLVIKSYFGISDRKKQSVNSINQAIYKQLRSHLDCAMKDYRDRVDKGEAKKII
jgi:hypothetical protein